MGFRPRSRRGGKVPGHASGAHRQWLRRQVRGLRPDRNPLRRGIDRAEVYLLAGLLAAAAAAAPLAAQSASRAAYSGALRIQQEQIATRHQVKAVLTESADTTLDGYTLSAEVPAKAYWRSFTGGYRTGYVAAPAGSAKGASVTAWTDANGDLASPPLTAAQVAGQGDTGAIGAVSGVAVVFLVSAGAVRFVLYRRRLAAWEADWLLTAPTWNRQSW